MTLQTSFNDEHADFCVVGAAGELDVATAPDLDRKLRAAIEEGQVHLVLDLTQVTFVDSTGLGVLVGCRNLVRKSGGTIRLVVTHRNVRKVLEITSLDTVFPIYESLEAALSAKSA
jgi:anti-sigma B factor antagonist